jgi:anti-sigma-K factor RskA
MKYQNAKLRRMLAAEYVLGLLRGPARRRFEKLAAQDAGLLAEQRFWEIRLAELGQTVAPVEPPEKVWIGLSHRIGLVDPAKVVPLRKPAAEPRAASPWRVGAGIAAAIAVVFGVAITQRVKPVTSAPPPVAQTAPPVVSVPTYVALLKMPDSSMQWTVSLNTAAGRMSVNASGEVPAAVSGHSVELWWISPSGPVALGVLPVSGSGVMPLPKELADASGVTLAVSLEPQGGSPTGQPTGPVLTSAAAVKAA